MLANHHCPLCIAAHDIPVITQPHDIYQFGERRMCFLSEFSTSGHINPVICFCTCGSKR